MKLFPFPILHSPSQLVALVRYVSAIRAFAVSAGKPWIYNHHVSL